jgi:hypothetical protein
MRRMTVALTTAAIAAGALGMTAPAQGALSATSTGTGLSITGDGSRNQVGLHLQLGGGGLEWRVHQTCILFCAEGVQAGPGCRAGADSSEVLCTRQGRGSRSRWATTATTSRSVTR